MKTYTARRVAGSWSGHVNVSIRPGRPAAYTGRGVPRSVRPSLPARGRSALRRLVYRLWAHLPSWSQRLIVRFAAPRVTLGVCAVILDRQGRLLLAHHPYRRRAGGWGLPGGFARRDEQPAAALRRELHEELAVDAVVGPLLDAETAIDAGHVTLYYHATFTGTARPNGVEIDTCRFVALPEAAALLGAPTPPWLQQVQRALARKYGRAVGAARKTRPARASHNVSADRRTTHRGTGDTVGAAASVAIGARRTPCRCSHITLSSLGL